jgi:hypothetical protein
MEPVVGDDGESDDDMPALAVVYLNRDRRPVYLDSPAAIVYRFPRL